MGGREERDAEEGYTAERRLMSFGNETLDDLLCGCRWCCWCTKSRTSTRRSALERLSKSPTAVANSSPVFPSNKSCTAVHPPLSLVLPPSASCPCSYYAQGGICIRGIGSQGLLSQNQHRKAWTRWGEGSIPSIGACRVGSVYGRAKGREWS